MLPLCLIAICQTGFAQTGVIQGTLADPSGAAIAKARVALLNSNGTTLRETSGDASGKFQFSDLPAGSYALRVEAPSFQPRVVRVEARPGVSTPVTVELGVAPVNSEVTVTATRAAVDQTRDAAHLVTTREREEFLASPLTTIGDALQGSPDIAVQQTTVGQVSPILRGLTGYQTLLLVDGIRYNTSIFRSGPNHYLAYIEPSQVQSIEAVAGPTGATFGSDALGGTINVLSRQARFYQRSGWTVHGDAALSGASSDMSGTSSAQIQLGTARVAWLFGAGENRHNDLRTGSALDSHNVFRRYFDLPGTQVRGLLGDRLQDTGFSQFGAHTKLALRPSADQSLTLWFQRGDLSGVRSYRDMLGGLGRLQARFEPQTLNFFYARYEKLRLGKLDSLSGTFSINSQRDDTLRQGLLFTDLITDDRNRVDVFGYASQGSAHLTSRWVTVFGGELYQEQILSRRFERDPLRGQSAQRRALYPDGSRYDTLGLFVQNSVDLVKDRLRAQFGGRWTHVHFNTYAARNRDERGRDLGVTDSQQSFSDATFNASLTWRVNPHLGLNALVGRGFRAPNLNDLGAVGLTGLGFEVPSADAITAGSLMTRDASEAALSAGTPMARLGPETLLNYELGTTLSVGRFYGRAQVFLASLENPIVRRTLLFPANAVPTSLAGIAVTPLTPTAAQRAQGVVAVVTASDPRAVKTFANDGQSRYSGIETVLRYSFSSRWSAQGAYSYTAGRDLNPNRPSRRVPPQQASASVRWVPGRRLWLEAGGMLVGAQNRFNAGDLDDERIGASRRRSDIATFFRGAVASAWLQTGPDGRLGTADDLFAPTAETLLQIQNRVLPIGSTIHGVTITNDASRAPMFLDTAGWFSLDLRGGYQLSERWGLGFSLMNALDRNYRVHGSGVDSPGLNAHVGFRYVF